ncbi:MAG TPA: NADP-dependent oxidoreductase [Frankiaceae bacterium]|nr:NADP-dependent oxidoreductase [Frankiaceae bacterium]
MVQSREWHLVRRPEGWPTADDVALVEATLPEPDALPDGSVLVRNLYLSVDPYMRGRMNAGKSYAPPYQLDKPMYGGAIGRVEASASPDVAVGTVVRHGRAWREWAVCRPSELERLDPSADQVPLPAYLGVLGMPGLTAWVGTYDIGAIRPGETMFISAASGAVGSIAGQLARLGGCRVIGSAGGTDKVAFLTDELGFDAAIDHRAGDLTGQLAAAAPEGIDVYFDNVGGEALRAAIANLNPFGRIAVCGMISSYNEQQPGPDNLFEIVARKLRVQGFIVGDHTERGPLFHRHVSGLIREGRLVYRQTVRPGIESTFDALLEVLRGGTHLGKMVVELPES